MTWFCESVPPAISASTWAMSDAIGSGGDSGFGKAINTGPNQTGLRSCAHAPAARSSDAFDAFYVKHELKHEMS
jgi:hypothetical protein